MYLNSCRSCSFEPEIIKIGQSSHKMYSNDILNFQGSTTILNSCTKKSGNLLKAPRFLDGKGPLDIVANVLNCDIIESQFKLQSRCYIPFQTNTIRKNMNRLFPLL